MSNEELIELLLIALLSGMVGWAIGQVIGLLIIVSPSIREWFKGWKTKRTMRKLAKEVCEEKEEVPVFNRFEGEPMTQKDCVYNATMAVIGLHGNEWIDVGDHFPLGHSEKRDKVVNLVEYAFVRGWVYMSDSLAEDYKEDPGILRKYCMAVVGNWWTKDMRLNGGKRYRPVRISGRSR